MGWYLTWLSGCNYDPYSDHIQGLWALAARKKQDIQIKVLVTASYANTTLLTGQSVYLVKKKNARSRQSCATIVSAPSMGTFTASIASRQLLSALYNIYTEICECVGKEQGQNATFEVPMLRR